MPSHLATNLVFQRLSIFTENHQACGLSYEVPPVLAVFMLCSHSSFVGQGNTHYFAQKSKAAEDN